MLASKNFHTEELWKQCQQKFFYDVMNNTVHSWSTELPKGNWVTQILGYSYSYKLLLTFIWELRKAREE